MRVLIVTSTFPLTRNDGLPRFVYDLAQALTEHCRVTVLAPHHAGAEFEAVMGKLVVKRFRYAWPPGLQRLAYGSGMPDNLRQSWLARVQVPSYFVVLGAAVRRLVRRQRFDVVNSHWLIPQGLGVALAMGSNRSCAHVATAHAGDVMMLDRLPWGKEICRVIARRTEMFLPVGDHVARRLNRMAGEEMAWATQPMGVDFKRFSAPPEMPPGSMPFDGNFILFVGRLVAIKGVDVLLDAMPALFATDPGLGLVVVGTGAVEDRLKDKTRQMGMADRVKFTGRLSHGRILPYLHACRALALPSIVGPDNETEGTPTVLAEALAAGCRVVATRTGGAAAVLRDGINGWLARPNDAHDLARKLLPALAHPGEGIGQQAQQTARQMDWGRVAERYVDHFKTAMNLRHQRKRAG